MKMPTSTDTKAKKEPSAPSSIDTDMSYEDAGKQCVIFLEKKMRNLEKRKKKMDLNKQKALNGEKLEKEAEMSLSQYDSVTQDLQFAGELLKQFVSINENHEETMKQKAKKEIKQIEEILKLQFTLDQLGGDSVRQDFITGKHGAVVLTKDNLAQLDALYQVISATRESLEKNESYAKKLNTAAEHLVNFVDGEDSQVVGTTYKQLKELVTLINGCGYFERVPLAETESSRDHDKAAQEVVQEEEEVVEEVSHSTEQSEAVIEQTLGETVESAPDNIAQVVEEIPKQPLNTLEQDAFFAPSSSPYQPSSIVSESSTFSSQPVSSCDISKPSMPDIQSFTHNRPFQFIQASYVMPEANSPSVVDPAVIAAQPVGAQGLQFMSPYDSSVVSSSSIMPLSQLHQTPVCQHSSHPSTGNTLLQSQSQQSQNATSSQTVNALGMPVDLTPSPVDLSKPAIKQSASAPSSEDFNVQSSFSQSDSLFPSQPASHSELNTSSLSGHSDSRTPSLRDDSISSMNYDIPPSIPMPPSQDGQVEPQEKKSPMNADAPVFRSMYTQGVSQHMSQPTAASTVSSDMPGPPSQSDFSNFGGPSADFGGSGDFQSSYQGSNGFANGNYGRGPGGNRGGYRGPRGSASGANNMSNRNGGSPIQQNGFAPRSSPTNTSYNRGGRGGNSYQSYSGPNPGYRSESFQTTGYGSNSFGSANNYPKRGGMNIGPGNSGYPPRPAGMGGNVNRGGAMRGGGGMIPRGGPRGGPHRGGFSRQ